MKYLNKLHMIFNLLMKFFFKACIMQTCSTNAVLHYPVTSCALFVYSRDVYCSSVEILAGLLDLETVQTFQNLVTKTK